MKDRHEVQNIMTYNHIWKSVISPNRMMKMFLYIEFDLVSCWIIMIFFLPCLDDNGVIFVPICGPDLFRTELLIDNVIRDTNICLALFGIQRHHGKQDITIIKYAIWWMETPYADSGTNSYFPRITSFEFDYWCQNLKECEYIHQLQNDHLSKCRIQNLPVNTNYYVFTS